MTGVELTMGGWFASSVIRKVVHLGSSYLGDNYDLHTGTREMLSKLVVQLPRIQSVIEAAEQRKITNKGLVQSLEQLKDVAYEAEDVLDKFEAKRIRESIKGKGKVSEKASSSGKMVKNLFFPDKELKELKSLVSKLDELCKGNFITTLNLIHSEKMKEHCGNLGSETTSHLAPGLTIFGRDEEIKLIFKRILNVIEDFNHKPLDDPNLQQGEGEGSGSLSDKIFRNLLSWGIPGKLMFIRTVIKGDAPEESKKGLLGMSESGKSMSSGIIEKGDAPEESKKGLLGMSGSGKSMSSGIIEKGDAPEESKKGSLGMSESGKSMSSAIIEKGYAPEQSKKQALALRKFEKSMFSKKKALGLSKFGKSMFSGTVKKGDVPEKIKEGLLGLSESEKSMFSGTTIKGDEPEQSKNIVTTITTIAEPHSIGNRKLAVIPIVGLGGVGKTTVAKKIYNDERVKEHFALEAWVYVSENHDVKKIMQEMLSSFKVCSIDSGSTTIGSENLNTVETMLIKTIKKQRFLLILDDLTDRTVHIWSRLRSVLYYGEVGSVVVVTTQSTNIANAIGTLPEVKLDVLKPDSFWELFQYYAFGGFKFASLTLSEQEELKKIGKWIVEKLHGLPLAGEVIGTLLSTRLEKSYWEDICGSDWWNIEGAREKILPSIGVGYNYLESELKQCFVFCSIFPKQYVFEKERLVQMWIAHGFIQPGKEEKGRLEKGEIRLEDIGRKWLGKLVDRIFFQPTLSDGKYVMHDLVRDLAIAVSTNEFCFVKSHDKHIPSSPRHLGIYCDNSEVEWTWENSTRLRTVILFGNWTNGRDKFIGKIFANNKGLRVLDSSYIVPGTNDPVNATCRLGLLRFVDLSFTGIKSIPDEFCSLCHLEVLDVRGCKFEKLPKRMNRLINLRHLYASSDTISLISSIGKLTKLQELEEFRIGKSNGHRISELKEMNEISGHLLLCELQKVSSKEEAAESKLYKKKYLKSLELRFDSNDEIGLSTEVKMEVLDALKPAPSLEIIKVGGCSGESLPDWMCSSHPVFYNLKVIHVSHFCLRSLPSFGELPFLEILNFHDLPSIVKVGSEFYGSSDVIFPSLKELTLSQMSRWRNWEDGEVRKTIFPHLTKLHLKDCRLLLTLPLSSLTSVVELTLTSCITLNIQTIWMPSLALFSISSFWSAVSIDCTRLKSLEVLHLTDIWDHVNFVGGLKYLVKLRELVIKYPGDIRYTYEEHPLDEISHEEYENQCLQSLTYLHLCHNGFMYQGLPRLGGLPSLRSLLIQEYFMLGRNMEHDEIWFNQLTSLEKLEFRDCWMLSCLPSQLHLLTSLKKLQISSCRKLRSLPVNGLPPNLIELYIEKCPDLILRCEPNQGDDWHKISHIPFVHLIREIGTPEVQSP